MKNTKFLAVLILVALVSSLALGQGAMAPQSGTSTKGTVIKGKAPVNKDVL